MREEHHSWNHPTHYPNVLHHNRGWKREIGRAVTGEDHDNNNQDKPGEMVVEKATGAIHDDTMVKPLEMIVSDRTDAINMPETGGMMSSHHATDGRPDGTLDDDRGATIADTTEMDPLDATHRTRYPSLTSMEKDQVAKVPTREHGSTACAPTCVCLSDANV